MSDLATAAGVSAETVNIDGKPVACVPMSVGAVAHLQAVLNALPRPHDLKAIKAELEGLPAEVVNPILVNYAEENRRWPPRLLEGADGALELLQRPEHFPDLLLALLDGRWEGVSLRGDVAAGREVCKGLVHRLAYGDMMKLFAAGFDLKPAEGGEPAAPKGG